jgi:DNA-binding NtrC family response regulator
MTISAEKASSEEIAVLFVDDEPDMRRAVKRFLAKSDFGVLTAGSADEALEILRRRQIGVLVADIKLPGMDGLSLLEKVRHLHPDTVRVVFSADVPGGQLQEWIDRGRIFRFISKPVDLPEFRRTLDGAVAHYLARRHPPIHPAPSSGRAENASPTGETGGDCAGTI